jgi:signal transduction histidine kinase
MRSLRRTLSVRFSLTMFVALLVIAFWAFLGARRILRQELDRGLMAAARIEAAAVAAGLPLPTHAAHREVAAFIRDVNRFVVIRDETGAVLAVNTPGAADLPADTAHLRHAAGGAAVWTTGRWANQRVRSVFLSVAHERPGDPRIVQVAASLSPLDAASRQVLLLMLATATLGTVATVLGGGWLSRSVVAPVAEIAEQADAVLPGTVGQRITAHAEVEEFNRLVGVLNAMLERMDRGVLAQRRVIADVGHDLRTPITAMQGEIEVTLRHERSPERYRQALASLLEEVGQLRTLSDTLLLLARVEAGDLAPQRVATDLRTLVAAAIERVGPRVGQHQVTFDPTPNGAGEAAVDARMVGLVLDHLLDNAVRHTPEQAAVTVRAMGDAAAAIITVEDDGPGVSDEMLPHLFERFYRGDPARSRGSGAGLGLTVSAAIVSAHGGTIIADRGTGAGFRVTVRLPRTVQT